jgi:hypothetical protein
MFPRVAEILGEMAKLAEKEGVKLLIENEASQNVGTSAELTKFLKLLPTRTIAINWDSLNGLGLGEKPYPDGYDVLPKDGAGLSGTHGLGADFPSAGARWISGPVGSRDPHLRRAAGGFVACVDERNPAAGEPFMRKVS